MIVNLANTGTRSLTQIKRNQLKNQPIRKALMGLVLTCIKQRRLARC